MSADLPAGSGLPLPRLIGMLTPSSNTVLEPLTSHMLEPLFPAVSAHFSRFRVTQIALDKSADSQFAQTGILRAADLLADARCEIIAWNGTSASWRGVETDERLCDAIQARTGIAATSAILALHRLIDSLSVKTIGLVTPYTADVQTKIIENFRSRGNDVVIEAHAGYSSNFDFSRISEAEIASMCARVAVARPDAIVILCTNMRGALMAAKLEEQLQLPILDSVAFTLWGCLDRLGVSKQALTPFGSIFTEIEPNAPLSVA